MTAGSGGVLISAPDTAQRYEQLRIRMLEQPGAPIVVVTAVVLVRQGMGVWMQLDDGHEIESSSPSGSGQPRARVSPPGAEHSELLAVLTGLVFNICKQKESA